MAINGVPLPTVTKASKKKMHNLGGASALGMQRQVYLCEFETSLIYKESSRAARTVTQKNHLKKQNKHKNC